MEFKYNQIIFDSLSKRMELEEIPLPKDLKNKDSFNKERSIKVRLYKSEKIEKLVLTEMLTSGVVNHQHGLIYPGESLNFYDFPIFDFMFALIGEGLFAITELHPLRKDESYRKQYIFPMEKLYRKAQKIPDPMQGPFDWIEEFLSGYGLFLGSTSEHLPEIEETFKRYLELWITYMEESKPIADLSLRSSISNFKKKFCKIYHENDPGRDMFYKNFGEDWTEKYYGKIFY